jgi:hypothetical protein
VISNRTDNILYVYRNREKDELREEGEFSPEQEEELYDTQIIVKKQRRQAGLQFFLKFDPQFLRFGDQVR